MTAPQILALLLVVTALGFGAGVYESISRSDRDGLARSRASAPPTCPDPVHEDAALTLLYPVFGSSLVGFSVTQRQVDDELAKIARWREHLSSEQDPCLRAGFTKWLDYFERQATTALAEQERRQAGQSGWEAEQREKQARVAAFLATRPDLRKTFQAGR